VGIVSPPLVLGAATLAVALRGGLRRGFVASAGMAAVLTPSLLVITSALGWAQPFAPDLADALLAAAVAFAVAAVAQYPFASAPQPGLPSRSGGLLPGFAFVSGLAISGALAVLLVGGRFSLAMPWPRAVGRASLQQPRPASKTRSTMAPSLALRAAIQTGDPAAVKAALARGADPNRILPGLDGSRGGFTPLNAAVLTGNTRVASLLIAHGARLNAGDNWYPTPLVAAVADRKWEMVRLLIAHGARVNDRAGGSRALWHAATADDLDAMKFLLAHRANPDTKQAGATLLHILQAEGPTHAEAARLLRLHGATE